MTTTNFLANKPNRQLNYLGLVHELSGPLTAAKLNLEQYFTAHNPINLTLLTANLELIEDYLNSARLNIKQRPSRRLFSTASAIHKIKQNFTALANDQSINLNFNIRQDIRLNADSAKFKQILSSVIRNAMEAYAGDRSISSKRVIVSQCVTPKYLIISVRDFGQGIKQADHKRIFEPFYSTKRNRVSGLGVGLSLVKQSIEEDFGGLVEFSSRPKLGTVFRLYFRR